MVHMKPSQQGTNKEDCLFRSVSSAGHLAIKNLRFIHVTVDKKLSKLTRISTAEKIRKKLIN